jgi:hypothetical protein
LIDHLSVTLLLDLTPLLPSPLLYLLDLVSKVRVFELLGSPSSFESAQNASDCGVFNRVYPANLSDREALELYTIYYFIPDPVARLCIASPLAVSRNHLVMRLVSLVRRFEIKSLATFLIHINFNKQKDILLFNQKHSL